MKKIKVYSGKTIENRCASKTHPVTEVMHAKVFVDTAINSPSILKEDIEVYSNSQDFVMAIKYIAKKHNVEVEFFLDGVSSGDSIEPTFADFNKALDLINELGATEE